MYEARQKQFHKTISFLFKYVFFNQKDEIKNSFIFCVCKISIFNPFAGRSVFNSGRVGELFLENP